MENVSKVFPTGTSALLNVTLVIEPGEFVFLVGHTGSGKTTLLRLLVRDMLPTEGRVVVGDFDVTKLPSKKIPELRKKVGIIFQDLKLLMDRTITENVLLPLQVAGMDREEAIKRVDELLEDVGLSLHKEKFPVQLSGGELQRVAIARALALRPEVLLADEPTGNLDPQTALDIVALLLRINESGTTVVMATHNIEIVNKIAKRVIGLDSGKLVKDEKKQKTGVSKSEVEKKAKQEKEHYGKHEKGKQLDEKEKRTEEHINVFVKDKNIEAYQEEKKATNRQKGNGLFSAFKKVSFGLHHEVLDEKVEEKESTEKNNMSNNEKQDNNKEEKKEIKK